MANTLMFEVGVSNSVKDLDKLKTELDSFIKHYTKDTAIKLRIEIDNLTTITTALSKIGDTPQLRNLRQEIEVLNREFSKMAVGAGGMGDLGVRKMNQDVEDLKQKWDSAIRTLGRYNEELALVRHNRDSTTNFTDRQGYTEQINKLKDNIKVQQEVVNNAKTAYDNAVKNAGSLVEVNTRAEASFREVKKSIDEMKTSLNGTNVTVNLGKDFAKWAQEVQNVTVSVRELVEQLQKMHNASTTALQATQQLSQAEQKGTPQGGLFDTQKFNTLQEAIDKIISEINRLQQAFTKLGENSSLSNLSTMINGLAVTLSTLSNAIKIQPLDEQVKALLERCEKAEAKLREVGDAAKYLNERAGAKTQQKASSIMGITGTDEEQLNKVSSTAERFMRLLVEIENQMAKIGKIQVLGEQSGFSPTLLKNAQAQLDALKKMVESTIKGTPIAEGLVIPASNSQLAQFIQQFGLLKAQYRDIITEADRFNKAQERLAKQNEKKDENFAKQLANDTERAAKKVAELQVKVEQYKDTVSKAQLVNAPTGQLQQYISYLQAIINMLNEIRNNKGLTNAGQSLKEILNGTFGANMVKGNHEERLIRDIMREMTKYQGKNFNPVMDALNEYRKVVNEITTLQKTGKSAEKFGIDISDINNKIAALERYRQELELIASGRGQRTAAELRLDKDYQNAVAAGKATDAVIKNTIEKEKNSRVTVQLSESEQRLAHAIHGSTDSMRGQINVLADLKTMATQYLGVWGAQQFVQNIIQIGGQLEQQRLSIGAILGDMAAGQHLFDQIKQLALTSPFGVMELDKNTKQLSAYGFKQSELFDMTKRLADISAGAGTEVSRLALALGHVRSEGALTGYTLRQFAMNNIPMLQKLSERLTKIEGQIVSTAEIRKRVSKKEIGYEDVIAVIKDLTNEGGMFFNMQETMAEAVNAKFKNLKDSMDIMYGEMAEGGIGSALKKVAESLMFLTRNWEETARVVGYGTAAFVAYRVAVSAANTQMLTYGSTLGATTKTLNAKAIALGINTAAVKRLTADEIKEMVTLKLVTREQLLNAVATKKLTVDQAELAAATFGVTRAELTSIATKGKLGVVSAGLGLRLRSLALSIRGVGVALKSMFLNPVGIALMAITGAFEVFMRWKQRNEEIAQSIDQLGKKGSEGYKNLAATMEKYSGKEGKMSESEYSTAIGDIIDQLKNYAPNIHNIQEEAQSIDSLAERYKYLRDELESTKNAYSDLERTKSFASNANESTGNMLNDTFTENVEDYISNVQKVDKAEQELMQHRVALEKTLDELEKKSSFKRRTDENGNLLSLVEQIKYIRSTDFNRLFSPMLYSNSQGASAAFGAYSSALHQMEERMRNEVMPDLQNFASRLNNDYASTFGKNWKENADHVKTAWMAVSSEIEKVPGMTENVKRDLLEKIFNETWHMNIDFSTGEVTESLTGWRKEMQDWLDEHGLKFSIGFNDSREDIYKKAKAAQETAQTEMNNAGQVLIGIGFKLNNLPGTLPSPLATPWNQKNLEDYNEQKNVNDLWEQFRKHFGANWQTKQDKASNKTKKEDDKDARRLREIVKLYKDAYEWYTKYEKQVGEGSALKKVQEQFKPLFDQFKDQFKQELSLDSIPLYKDNLESLLEEAEKLYKSPKHKNSYMVEAIKQIRDAINNVDYEELGRKQDVFASEMSRQLDELTRKWDIFNSVIESTGDRTLAARLTGITPGATPADLKRLNVSNFAGVKLNFDSVLGMSDDDIDKYVESLGVSEEKIKAIQNGLKDWKKAQEDVSKSDIQNYAKWLGSLVDLQSIQTRNQEEYNRVLEETNRLLKEGKITQEKADRRKASAGVELETKNWQATVMYSNLYNNAQSMAEGEFFLAFNREMANLFDQFKQGNITAADYAEKIEKLNKIQTEFSSRGFLGIRGGMGAFLGGGYQGLIDYHRGRAKDYRSNGRDKEAKEEDDKAASMEKSQKAADELMKAFQDLANGANLLGDLFENMGWEDGANAMSDVGGLFGGMLGGASSMSALGPYGMAAGAALGLASGLFALHDKALQRQIDALKKNAEALQANTDSIKAARSRTYGYDTGDLRRQMARQYSADAMRMKTIYYGFTKVERADADNASREMANYYKRNTDKSGYAAELENLKEQRKLYMEMYNLESDKKNDSQEALDEYKEKVAELDEQILFFVEDMTNELWGIDFKSWADQISDALWTAFENGESALEAFHDTARDIISDVAKRMMNIHLIEPVFNELEDKLFGQLDSNGQRTGGVAYNMRTGEFNEMETMKVLGKFFSDDGPFVHAINQAEDFYSMAKKASGVDFASEDSSKSTGSSIKGITEQTADLLASYVNACRASASNIENMTAQYFPMFYQTITSSNASLTSIQQHTAAIMRSNDSIAQSVSELQSDIRGLRNKAWKVPMA